MEQLIKDQVEFEPTFGALDIRVGRVMEAALEPSTPKKTYKMTIDFGKYGIRTSVGRFTMHPLEEVVGRKVLGVLNFGPRQMGDVVSEVLVLGVQYPKADSGEATFVSPAHPDVKIGSKLF